MLAPEPSYTPTVLKLRCQNCAKIRIPRHDAVHDFARPGAVYKPTVVKLRCQTTRGPGLLSGPGLPSGPGRLSGPGLLAGPGLLSGPACSADQRQSAVAKRRREAPSRSPVAKRRREAHSRSAFAKRIREAHSRSAVAKRRRDAHSRRAFAKRIPERIREAPSRSVPRFCSRHAYVSQMSFSCSCPVKFVTPATTDFPSHSDVFRRH